jgi:hypothetical protein
MEAYSAFKMGFLILKREEHKRKLSIVYQVKFTCAVWVFAD